MDTKKALQLIETNAKLIGDQLHCTESLLQHLSTKRAQVFRCEECNKWKKHRIEESTLEASSDDNRDLACTYDGNGIEKG